MKKILYTLIAFSFILFTGCGDDYLTVSPEVVQGATNYYQTKDQFIQAVNGAYAPLQGLHTTQLWALTEMRSDNTSYQRNLSDRSGFPYENLDEFQEQTDNTHTTNFFISSYRGASRCNLILDRIDASSIDQATKDVVSGQALFLRAFYYFQLVRVFGDVPLVLKEVKSTSEAFELAKRKPAADVYASILTDIKAAIDKLPEVYTVAADKGRATKGAARTLLAEIYMTQKNYTGATEQLRAVVQSGKYSLNATYYDNFNVTKKNGPESIFEIQFIEGATLGESSNFIYTFAPYNSKTAIAGFNVYAGSGSGWNVATQDLLDAYETGDLRKAASIGSDFIDPNNNKVVPYAKKYQSVHAVQYQTANNFVVYRYADVKLLLAECLNETSFVADGEAFQLLNDVRVRAGLQAKSTASSDPLLKVASQDEFRSAIAHERQVELAFENHRWFDLVRTDKAVTVMQTHGAREKTLKSYVVAAAYQDIRLQNLYPQQELNLLAQ